MTGRSKLGTGLALLFTLGLALIASQEAFALITGGDGNTPIADPGWPKGAAEIFNTKARVAWWEGPPLGGGQWHAECRGDAKQLNAILDAFAGLEVRNKRVVVHDGVGHSVWLDRAPAKRAAAKIDWVFMVWQEASWQQLRKLPADINPTGADGANNEPPAQLDVYTGGNVRWADVVVPKGLKIDDQRLEAHGFTTADGLVLEGKVTDLASKDPLIAKVRLERLEPQKKGGYSHTKVVETTCDAKGHWVLKKVPAGWYQVVAEADGYVPRLIGYNNFDDQPGWHKYDCGLALPARVSGRVADEAGKPLADVEVRFSNVVALFDGYYQSPLEWTFKTDAEGSFQTDRLPVGKATIWVYKTGYCRPGLGLEITTPKEDVKLTMQKSARLQITVDFTGKTRPNGYMVHLAPAAGEKIGTYGGAGNINAKNQMLFDNVPPGIYVIFGRPNPGAANQQTDAVTVELKGGQQADVTLRAK